MVLPSTPSTPRPSLPAPGVALSLLAESVAHRVELAGLELGEARDHACRSALLAAAAGAFVLFTGFAFTLLVASLVWDQPHRGWWLGGLGAVYLAAAVAASCQLVRRLGAWRPFPATQVQLQKDHQCLAQLTNSAAS